MRPWSVIATVLLLASAAVAAGMPAASWQVGRAYVDAASQIGARLKISLRNQGSPVQAPVQILGRWQTALPAAIPSGGASQELRSYKPLGTFVTEVSLKQTAVVEMSLAPLGRAPASVRAVELIVLTGQQITDREVVSYQGR